MWEAISNVLRSAWQEFLSGVQIFLPHLLAMLSLILVGWLLAWILSLLLRQFLRVARFDVLADRLGTSGILKRLALPAASDVVASMVFWLLWVAFMLSGLGALGFSGVENLAAEFVTFLPRLGVGVVLFVVGMVAANFAWRATLLAAVNADLPSARLLSGAVRWLVVALTVAMSLEQIGVAKTTMMTAFGIAFGAVMLGVAVAIGIGGAPIARRVLERQFPEPPKDTGSGPGSLSHL